MSFPNFDVLANANEISGNAYIWVSVDGDDTNGNGTFNNPYASWTAALAVVTASRKDVMVLPGDYVEAACVSWPTINGANVFVLGDATISTTTDEDQVIEIAPGAQTATFIASICAFGTLCVDHGNDGQDGVKLTHTSVGKKMIVNVKNVYDNSHDSGDKFITVTHGGDGNAVRIYMEGHMWDEIEGAVYFQSKDGGDRLYAQGCWFEGGIEFSTDATALTLRLKDCMVLHESVTGGSTSTVVSALNCFSHTSGTIAALDANDIAGNITGESVIGAS